MRIRELREDRDWTQQDIADRLYINRRTYSAYENGVNAISAMTLVRMAELFDTSVDYIIGLTDEPRPYPRVRVPASNVSTKKKKTTK